MCECRNLSQTIEALVLANEFVEDCTPFFVLLGFKEIPYTSLPSDFKCSICDEITIMTRECDAKTYVTEVAWLGQEQTRKYLTMRWRNRFPSTST